MPTIQLKLTDDEYQELLDTTNESTGTKAVMRCINDYPDLLDNKRYLISTVAKMERELDTIKSRTRNFTNALELLKEGTGT